MAKFKIELETDIGRVLLTDFESKSENNIEMTFDESLEEGENDTYTLTFSIPQKINNIPIGNLIVISRPIWLTFGHPERSVRMIISSITEGRGEKNKIFEVEAQDYASYIYSKNNAGLYFDSFEDEEFLKIMEEKWDENDTPENDRKPTITEIADYILERGWLKKDSLGWTSEYIREVDPQDATNQYLKYVNVEVDNSNTYNALLELANAAQALIRFDYDNKKVYFVDKENASLDKKFLLREDFNLEELSLSKAGEELFGILYVDGIQDENDEYVFLEEGVPYRDNFLYDLEYYKETGLITSAQLIQIKDRIENESNSNSLVSINKELEEVIKMKHELEGQIREIETRFTNHSDLLIAGFSAEEFSKNYELFWRSFVKEEVDYEGGQTESISYKYEDFFDLSFISGLSGVIATPINLNRMMIKINNSYLMFGRDIVNETTDNTIVRLGNKIFNIKFSTEESVSGYTIKEKNTPSPYIVGSSEMNIFVKNEDENHWDISWNDLFIIEKSWFSIEFIKNSYKRYNVFPYFDLLYRLGGRKLIETKYKYWINKVEEIKKEWRETRKELEDLKAQGGPLAGSELIKHQEKIAYLEDLIEGYRAEIGGYEFKDNGSDYLEYDDWEEVQPMGRYKIIRNAVEDAKDIFDGKPEYSGDNLENVMKIFYDLLKSKREFWYDLKEEFGRHIFTEGYYEDEVETDPLILLHQARRAQKDHNKPLEQIQATYINLSDIVGIDILEPRVGDYIWVQKRDEGVQSDKRLKVESVSRILRLDGSVEYEIAKFNPGNRLIEKLLKQLQDRN